MKNIEIQMLMASTGAYVGGIDGVIGGKSLAAIAKTLDGLGRDWSPRRRLIAAGQIILNASGHEAGVVDGYAGHNTINALSSWLYERAHGERESVVRNGRAYEPIAAAELPRQRDLNEFYGVPGSEVSARLETVSLPFELRIDYNLAQTTRRVTLHRKCARSFVKAITAVRAEYGAKRMFDLGIDRYAGGYNHRKMRGGSQWSTHAYGCAVDFRAKPNGLRARCPDALFCGIEYQPFLDIMESHGWLPALRLWGADAMHFQQARL